MLGGDSVSSLVMDSLKNCFTSLSKFNICLHVEEATLSLSRGLSYSEPVLPLLLFVEAIYSHVHGILL